jgi:hypothetical protein
MTARMNEVVVVLGWRVKSGGGRRDAMTAQRAHDQRQRQRHDSLQATRTVSQVSGRVRSRQRFVRDKSGLQRYATRRREWFADGSGAYVERIADWLLQEATTERRRRRRRLICLWTKH